MDTRQAVINRILQLCGKQDLTIKRLANLSAVPLPSVRNLLYRKGQNPKITTLKKLCDGFGITLGEFFSTEEFDSLEQEIR